MAVDLILCGATFDSFMTGTILPLVGIAAMTTSLLIAISFMAGRALSNPKLILWSKTEIIQLGISLFTIFIITASVTTFCNLNVRSIEEALGLTPTMGATVNIYQAASEYLRDATIYTHNAIVVSRYQLEAYTVLSYFSAFECDWPIGRVGIGCWFGWGGTNMQNFGGYGAAMAALNTSFNSLLITYFTLINHIFILLFIYKGFAFFFLPVGILMRSLPYLRHFGAVLIAISMAFLIVYPAMLAIFNIMGDVLLDRPHLSPEDKATTFKNAEAWMVDLTQADFLGMSAAGPGTVEDNYIGGGKGDIGYALMFTAYAFIAGGFFPSVALLATIASVSYIARLYGDEIDLSRIVQMV
ncbi:MAG: hypothetical protein ABID61_00270 [Candidatus Micrarchaeota archaeon]